MSVASRPAPAWLDRLMAAVTHAGGATATIALPLGLTLVPTTRTLGVVASVANLVSHLLVQLLKRTVVRARPALGEEICPLVVPLDVYSFPSGHACAATAVAVSLYLAGGVLAAPLLLLALAVAASRVYLRVHYLTDVLVGQGLGAAAALLSYGMLAPV